MTDGTASEGPATDAPATATGRCLCGDVSYTTSGLRQRVLQCHCSNCRRSSGNFVAAARTATAELDVADPAGRLRWHDLGYARYGFCGACGSSLFYRAAESEEVTSVFVGTLDEASGLSIEAVWFAGEVQPHNTLPSDVPHHAGNG